MAENNNHADPGHRVLAVLLTGVLALSGWSLWKINAIDEEVQTSMTQIFYLKEEVIELHKNLRDLEIYTYPGRHMPQ